MENKFYYAFGEEASRGTKEVTTVGFVPLGSIPKVKFDPKEEFRKQVRGEETLLGNTSARRLQSAWSRSIEIDGYSEAGGTAKGMIGTILKHFFSKVTSSQNATTGQYRHMMYPVSNPFAASALGTKALTVNENLAEGISGMKNWPWVGGRVKGLTFTQDPAQILKISADMFGQFRDTTTAELGSPVFPAENLRFDNTGLKVYTGTITRTGTAPDFTQFAFGSATQVYPQKVVLKLEDGKTDVMTMSGVNYANKTRLDAIIKATLEMQFDWEDPASGFSSIDEFNAWVAAFSQTNFCLVWDSGTQAGTGDNHMLIVDLPAMKRSGGDPDFQLDKDPAISLSYEGMMDAATCKYLVGLLLKNTAMAV